MQYRLEHIDKLVTTIIKGEGKNPIVLSGQDYAGILHEALEEKDRICSFITEQVFRFSKEKEIELFIKNYQLALTSLLDRLYRHQQIIISLTPAQSGFYDSFYQNILLILSFVEERFSRYFDREEKVPDVYLLLTIRELKGKMDSLAEILSFSGIDSVIFQKILDSLLSFTKKINEKSVTYKDVMYRKELTKELLDIRSWPGDNKLYTGLDQLLIYLNYNDKEFVNYKVNRFVQELSACSDLNEKIDRLLLYSKTLNQLQIKPDSALHPRHPSVKAQFSNWLSEELYYLEKKLGMMNVTPQTAGKELQVHEGKVLCHLSVDQLGIIFRAASDIKVISAPSQKALFEKITPFLSTPYKKVLSPDSMRSKSYTPEQKDLEAMKDVLMQLYKKLTQY